MDGKIQSNGMGPWLHIKNIYAIDFISEGRISWILFNPNDDNYVIN